MAGACCTAPLDVAPGEGVPADAVQARLDAGRRAAAPRPTPSHAPAAPDATPTATTAPDALPHSTRLNGRFVLLPEHFPDFEERGFSDFVRWRRTVEPVVTPPAAVLERELPVQTPDAAALCAPPGGAMQCTWLGHASVLVQWDGWTVLADPIFSRRCAPVQFAGPARLRPPPLQAAALPPVDAVVISHNHYDHLDAATARALAARRPAPMWFVPLGMKAWLAGLGVANVVEMDWAEEAVLADPTPRGRPDLRVHCLPSQHWCGRGLRDRNRCLWAAWLAATANGKYFFGGDTGYCPVFAMVGRLHGPIDLAAIPIGAYGADSERWFHKSLPLCPSCCACASFCPSPPSTTTNSPSPPPPPPPPRRRPPPHPPPPLPPPPTLPLSPPPPPPPGQGGKATQG